MDTRGARDAEKPALTIGKSGKQILQLQGADRLGHNLAGLPGCLKSVHIFLNLAERSQHAGACVW